MSEARPRAMTAGEGGGVVDTHVVDRGAACGGLAGRSGADVRSAGLEEDYRTDLTGTSIATPFVAGIAALYAQACKDARGQALWDLLVKKARPVSNLSVEEAGAGIVRAPLKTDDCVCDLKPPCVEGEQK